METAESQIGKLAIEWRRAERTRTALGMMNANAHPASALPDDYLSAAQDAAVARLRLDVALDRYFEADTVQVVKP